MSTKTNKNDFIKHRREGRILAFQAIFSYDFNPVSTDDLLRFDWLESPYSKESFEYAAFLIKGTIENLETRDNTIKSKLINWDFARIASVDKAILRFSIFSLLFEKELPEKVIINEAIEIVKQFGSDDSYKFVNGILDAVKKSKKPG
jgi:N utilization substance protein B